MDSIKIWGDAPSRQQASQIATALEEGEIIIVPTDSVYALACDALNSKAIAELCLIKGLNPEKNHLSIVCSDISMASEYANFDNSGYNILKEYTPGAFTFLFRASRNLPKVFKGRKTVGIRIPESGTLTEIVKALGHPILTTSIEFDNDDEAREPSLIAERYDKSRVSLIVDGGDGGNEFTTVVDCRESESPEIIRQGKGIME